MENTAYSSDKIFYLMKDPFKYANQDRESISKLLKTSWTFNSAENPFSEDLVAVN